MTPNANFHFTPAEGGIAPQSVVFSDLSTVSSGAIVGWLWNFGDGSISTEQNPTHEYKYAATFQARLTITDSDGQTTSLTVPVPIVSQSQPAPILAPKADFKASVQTGVAPLSISFQNTSTGVIIGYAWSFGDGNTSEAKNPTHVFKEPGVFETSLTVFNEFGSTTRTYRIDATAPDSVTAEYQADTILDLVASIRAGLRRPSDQKLRYQDILDVLNDILRGYARDLQVSNQHHRTDERQAILNHLDGNIYLLTVPGLAEVEPVELSFRPDNPNPGALDIWRKTSIVPLDYFGERFWQDEAVASFFGGVVQQNGVKVKLNLPPETVAKSTWRIFVRVPLLKLIQMNAKTALPSDFVPMIKTEAKLQLLPYFRDDSQDFYNWRKLNEPLWIGQKMEWHRRWEDFLNTNVEPNVAPKIPANAYRFKGMARRGRYTIEPREK